MMHRGQCINQVGGECDTPFHCVCNYEVARSRTYMVQDDQKYCKGCTFIYNIETLTIKKRDGGR